MQPKENQLVLILVDRTEIEAPEFKIPKPSGSTDQPGRNVTLSVPNLIVRYLYNVYSEVGAPSRRI